MVKSHQGRRHSSARLTQCSDEIGSSATKFAMVRMTTLVRWRTRKLALPRWKDYRHTSFEIGPTSMGLKAELVQYAKKILNSLILLAVPRGIQKPCLINWVANYSARNCNTELQGFFSRLATLHSTQRAEASAKRSTQSGGGSALMVRSPHICGR